MKKSMLLTLILTVSILTIVSAQSEKEKKSIEIEVRKLDSLHAAAVLNGDLKEMDKYWTEDFMVNNPFNEIDRANRIRNGAVTYISFQRICEAVQIRKNTAILMGKEIVVPKGKSPDAGKTINRRYTNIWMKLNGQWRLVARHASVICS
ncbi:MAG: nuclear transport factor 2 family protein [Chitinophagaceae bacterium]|nr:nuclear transport factor 2 family protein [Chitinophagaceae bacterium]MBK7121706.1 nuclear transport factor 2 family protein [Chitinophagaceae bacterium]MBK7559368.1 nuclear transport factor 2 family protein [Chitinophagaceae bacterium]MBK9532148.1 nuclear transport factor 2 family protein [Chitinophagaceae bacterium]HQW91691.1 nuclear transport factor 2 family protein [Ferruginibacter sp.]